MWRTQLTRREVFIPFYLPLLWPVHHRRLRRLTDRPLSWELSQLKVGPRSIGLARAGGHSENMLGYISNFFLKVV